MNEQYPNNFGNMGQPYIGVPGGGINTNGTAAIPNWNRPNPVYPTQPQFIPQQSQPVVIPGKVVNSHDDIGPQDVPMNGQVSFFPKSDYSEIYAKCWTNDGRIDTRVYIVKPVENATEASNGATDVLSEILSRLEAIEKKISHKPHYNNRGSLKYQKPEGGENK